MLKKSTLVKYEVDFFSVLGKDCKILIFSYLEWLLCCGNRNDWTL